MLSLLSRLGFMAAVSLYARQDRQHLGHINLEKPSAGPLSISEHCSTATTVVLQPALKLNRCQMLLSGAGGLQVNPYSVSSAWRTSKDLPRIGDVHGFSHGQVMSVALPWWCHILAKHSLACHRRAATLPLVAWQLASAHVLARNRDRHSGSAGWRRRRVTTATAVARRCGWRRRR